MKIKSWQIGVIVVGLLVGVGSIAYTLTTGGGATIADHYFLVDVETGDLYKVNTKKYALYMPALRPGSDRRTLVPVQQQDGVWHVGSNWLNPADMPEDVEFKAVDRNTGEVSSGAKAPVWYTPPKHD